MGVSDEGWVRVRGGKVSTSTGRQSRSVFAVDVMR